MKVRIVERTMVDGRVKYVVQQRHWLFWWVWCDAWMNSIVGASCQDSFSTLKEAKDNLCYFDGSKPKDRVLTESEVKDACSH